MTDKQENTLTAADQSEQGSGTTPDTQEALQDTSSDKGALPSINFDVPTEDTPQRQLTAEEFQESVERVSNSLQNLIDVQQEIARSLPPVEKIMAGIQQMINNISQMVWGDTKKGLEEIFKALQEGFEEARIYAEKLKPFIEKELKAAQKTHPEIEEITADDIVNDLSYFLVGEIEEAELEELQQEFSDNTDPILQNIKLIYGIVEKAKEAFEAGKDKSLLPQISPILPHSHLMPNNTLMNYLTQYELVNAGMQPIPVLKGRKNTSAHVLVEYGEDPNISTFSISEYERQVSDSIITIWEEANKRGIPAWFTADTVFRNMPGEGEKPSPQQKGAITKAIERFRKLHIFVNATDEMRARGLIGESEEFTYDAFYLSVTRMKCTVKNGGQTVEAYRIDSEPIIYNYCKLTGQIITVPRKCIEIKKTKKNPTTGEITISTLPVPMTPTRQAMTGYILRRIEVLKRDRKNKKKQQKQSDIIRFDALFRDVGLEDQDRNRAKENRKFCYQVLDFFTGIDRIKGYEEQKKGRSITGVKILL